MEFIESNRLSVSEQTDRLPPPNPEMTGVHCSRWQHLERLRLELEFCFATLWALQRFQIAIWLRRSEIAELYDLLALGRTRGL